MTRDVAEWLRGLGLEQYAVAFRDNDIDAEVLPDLTADDLISLGNLNNADRHQGDIRLWRAPSLSEIDAQARNP